MRAPTRTPPPRSSTRPTPRSTRSRSRPRSASSTSGAGPATPRSARRAAARGWSPSTPPSGSSRSRGHAPPPKASWWRSSGLIDYPQRLRLKIIGHARTVDARADPTLADRVSPSPELRARVERVFVIDVVGFYWNCPAYITPRYTAAEVEDAVAPLRERVAQLEAELAAERVRR